MSSTLRHCLNVKTLENEMRGLKAQKSFADSFYLVSTDKK